jgi:long-chain acyl-CoA synthetase
MLPIYERSDSLGAMLHNSSIQFKDKTAVISQQTSVSYAQIESFSNQVADFLIEKGIGRGSKIGLYCINSPWFVIAYFGVLKTGATVVPVNLLFSAEEIQYILSDSESAGIFYFEGFENNVAQIKDSLPNLRFLVAFNRPGIPGAVSLDEILKRGKTEYVIPEIDQNEDLAAILYTSGTTGSPKGAMLTHHNLLFNVSSILKILNVDEKDTFLTVLPMFHAFGATAGMITPLTSGATIAAVPRFIPDVVAQTIKKTKATIFLGVPSMYRLLTELPDKHIPDLSSLRFCISGGDALPVEVMEQFEKKYKILIYEGDGPTECSPVTAVNPIGGKRKLNSIGKALPGVEMKIVDDSGREAKLKEVGEIVVRGENVMKGYFKRPEETGESFFGEWFRTGDLGYEDEEEYFYIVDRKKDMVIVNGMNVYPRMVENVILKHPAVSEVAVVPEPHPLHGEVPRAVIVLKPEAKATKSEITKFCAKHLGRHEIPRIVEFTPELPKTPTGKVLKRLLRSGRKRFYE